jgi:hypothetical protein
MLDVLQLRITPDDFDQLRQCQVEQRSDCHAAFTVKSAGVVWPQASWNTLLVEDRINVRGWFPLLDQMADEFLIWWPQGGCFFVDREMVTYRAQQQDTSGVLFLQLEVNRMKVVPKP